MNRRVIGPVVIEWSDYLLTVRRTFASGWFWILLFGGNSVYEVIYAFDEFNLRHWFSAVSRVFFALLFFHLVFTLRIWRDKMIFDRVTDCVRDLRAEYGLLGSIKQTEYGTMETMTAQVFENKKRFGVAVHDASGNAIELTMMQAFKKKEQAQEVADILNAFLHQPAVTETPGVWPPPPRVPGATHG